MWHCRIGRRTYTAETLHNVEQRAPQRRGAWPYDVGVVSGLASPGSSAASGACGWPIGWGADRRAGLPAQDAAAGANPAAVCGAAPVTSDSEECSKPRAGPTVGSRPGDGIVRGVRPGDVALPMVEQSAYAATLVV
ncbi:hypothetical protein MCHIJ_11980 [Mycolicibacterium chitae]|nr:hypothetical protein MCHIJ_11980 [Mycolicibacterium chitae]